MRAGSRGQIILPVIGRNGYPGADFGAPGWQFEPGRCPVCFNEVVRCLGQRQGWAESLDLCFVYKSPFLDSCDWGGLPGVVLAAGCQLVTTGRIIEKVVQKDNSRGLSPSFVAS